MELLLLIGPPGSGKGTLARMFAQDGYVHLSTGELLRERARTDAALAAALATGNLIEDATVTALLRDAAQGHDRVLLDGYPRTLTQVPLVDELFAGAAVQALHLDVPEPTLLARIARRGADSGRPEDAQDKAAHRLRIYDQDTAPLLSVYAQRGVLRSISGSGTPEEVERRARAALRERAAPQP